MKTTETTEGTATSAATDLDLVPAEVPVKQKRGFATMDPARVREIASKGGKMAHVHGTAHTFSTEEARAAGSKGGKAKHVRRGRVPKAAS